MHALALRRWTWVHKWSSLICTGFMLLLCLTGLPLIFHHEIGHWLGTEVEPPVMPAGTPMANLDRVAEAARIAQPGMTLQYLFQAADEPELWHATLGRDAATTEDTRSVVVDARSAAVLAQPKRDEGFMYLMFRLHVDLFADLPGKLFLGGMGLLLVVALVSGVVIYAPFMRKLDFGTVRRQRSRRLFWLDQHNLLGIVTLMWALVVGGTGVINTWADLLIKLWQYEQVSEMVAPYRGQPAPTVLGSLAAAARVAYQAEPDKQLGFVAFPGTLLSSPYHYTVFMRGQTPVSARLFKPVLVDARSAQLTASREPPWYITGLLLSQPLHFGDYGGMPLKIIWALLDILTIVVLGSGLYLWWVKHRRAGRADEAATQPLPSGKGMA
ncbi:MAG: PepSY-associated TM helix domain-containing protein [Roseateles sp.]